jgi:hypothetical protein
VNVDSGKSPAETTFLASYWEDWPLVAGPWCTFHDSTAPYDAPVRERGTVWARPSSVLLRTFSFWCVARRHSLSLFGCKSMKTW